MGVGQGRRGIDQEHVCGGVLAIESPAPVVADVLVDVGMGLDEYQPGAACGVGQFLGHPGAAIFLLRGGYQQYVAVGQEVAEAGEVGAGRAGVLGGVGVGTVDQDQVGQWGQIALDQFDVLGGDAQHLGGKVRAADQRGSCGGGSLAAGPDHLGPQQCVDQGTLAGAGAAQGGHDQGRFEPDAERLGPLCRSVDQCSAGLGRLPGGRRVGPALKPAEQGVDLGEEFEMEEFRRSHTPRIADVGQASHRRDTKLPHRMGGVRVRGGRRWNSGENWPMELFRWAVIRYA